MRKHDLENVAAGIASSFVSRNNDWGGYWAMGLLRGLAVRRGVEALRLPLLPSQPCGEQLLDGVAQRYRVMLERALSRLEARGQVVAAEIVARFLPAPPGRPWPANVRGLPAECEVRLRDVEGREVVWYLGAVCDVHDAAQETRSVRGERDDFAALQRDPAAWQSMVVEACAAAGVPCGEVRAFGDCANLVAAVGVHVVKLFPPFHRHQWQSERVGLRHFVGWLPVRVPQRIADGERGDGWCWVVQELVPGVPIEGRWSSAAQPDCVGLLEQIGAVMRVAHALPVGGESKLEPEWSAFLRGQRDGCLGRHRRLGAPACLLRDIPQLLDEWAPRLAADPRRVVLTGEYTPFNLLVGDDDGLRLQSMIDFGDAMVGVPEYDLLGPSLFLCGGDAELVAALLRGYHGADLPMTQELRMRLMALAVMHRYANFELQVRIDRWWDRARSLEQLAELIWPA